MLFLEHASNALKNRLSWTVPNRVPCCQINAASRSIVVMVAPATVSAVLYRS